jgi:deazaflavin-dependent oxidoreductase (nitroreductase family)
MSDTTKTAIGTDISLLGEEHVRRYRETDGEVGHIWNGATALLLSMTGRKSGEERTIPIIYTQVSDVQVIMASKGGAPEHPVWYLNLLAEPHVKVQIKGEKFDAIARTATGPERAWLWGEAIKQWPSYDIYQSRTSREIPVVVLERVRT